MPLPICRLMADQLQRADPAAEECIMVPGRSVITGKVRLVDSVNVLWIPEYVNGFHPVTSSARRVTGRPIPKKGHKRQQHSSVLLLGASWTHHHLDGYTGNRESATRSRSCTFETSSLYAREEQKVTGGNFWTLSAVRPDLLLSRCHFDQ